MPLDAVDFDAWVARDDLRIMRAALEKMNDRSNWCVGYSKYIDGDVHCVVGWLNVCAGESPSAIAGRAISARRLFPELPPPLVQEAAARLVATLITIPSDRAGEAAVYCRSSAVESFNDCEGWSAIRDVLARAVAKLEVQL